MCHDISGRNYSTSIFGRVVKFGCLVWPSGQQNLAVRILFIWHSGFGHMGKSQAYHTEEAFTRLSRTKLPSLSVSQKHHLLNECM